MTVARITWVGCLARSTHSFALVVFLGLVPGCGGDGPPPRERLVDAFSLKYEVQRRCVDRALEGLPEDAVQPLLDGVNDDPMDVYLSADVMKALSTALDCPKQR